MATLEEIWRDPARDTRWVAVREAGNGAFVALGHKTPDAAFADAAVNQELGPFDRNARDWYMAEIEPYDEEGHPQKGRPKKFHPRPAPDPDEAGGAA